MNKSVVTLLIVCGVFAVTARQASAQGGTWADRGYINVGWGVESGSSALTDTRTATIYEETATINSAATFSSGSLFDVGAGGLGGGAADGCCGGGNTLRRLAAGNAGHQQGKARADSKKLHQTDLQDVAGEML